MSVRTCCHPHCDTEMRNSQFACGRHWHQLSDDLKARVKAAKAGTESGALAVEAADYLVEERMVGDHEIVTCRGKDCGELLVWLTTRRGYRIPVKAESVADDDEIFDRERHSPHWITCPNAADFRKAR